MTIDWSKAPEGATHYATNDGARNNWLKLKPSGSAYHHDGFSWIRYPDNSPFRESHIRGAIARPEITEWSGEGLPPVGTVCECRVLAGAEWTKCEVVAHKIHKGSVYAIAFVDENTVMLSAGIRFRPIRTPEQIAAEEREKAVSEMAVIALAGDNDNDLINTAWLERLYDAGYRKQVKP